MLNRFFSRNGKSKTDQQDGQGSLLDLFDADGSGEAGNVVDFSTARQSSNSLLSDINNSEIELEHARQAAYAEQAAARRTARASREALWNNPPISPTPDREPVETNQQEQLELLTKELGALAQRAREREDSETAQSEKEEAQNTREKATPVGALRLSEVPNRLSGNGAFSFESVARTLLRSWMAVVTCGLIGAILAAFYALSLPNRYESVVEVLIEPRGVTVIENSVAPNGLNREATIAYAQSQVRILRSSSVLDPVIEDLELAEDPEFNGTRPAGGLFGTLLNMAMGKPGNPGERFARAKEYLYENMSVSRINQTFTIQISVTTEEPAKSARIANTIARGYMNAESRAKSSAARSATEDLTGRLDELRAQVRMAEEKVEAYKAENGLVDAEGKLVSEVQLTRLNEQLAVARSQAGDARSRAEQAARADLSDVLSGSLPTALASPTISQLRVQYSRAKSRLDRVSTTLGPRHPERIGAQAELRSARQAIAGELSRIVESAQEDYQSARSRLVTTQGQVNTLKASAVTDSAAKVKLRELEREVDANRRVYETYLIRSRETGEQENLRTESARIISEATPPVEKEGPNRKLITLIGGLAGAGLGVLFALFPLAFGATREFMSAGRVGPVLEPQTAAYDDDLYSSHAAADAQPEVVERVAVTSPPLAPETQYRGSPSSSVAKPGAKRKRKTKLNASGHDPVTREELEMLRQQIQNQDPQPHPAQPVQMPLFPQPQAYMPYPQPQPVYPAYPAPVPMMQPVAYAPPVMHQPVQMAYPAWPQQPTPTDDASK